MHWISCPWRSNGKNVLFTGAVELIAFLDCIKDQRPNRLSISSKIFKTAYHFSSVTLVGAILFVLSGFLSIYQLISIDNALSQPETDAGTPETAESV